MVKKILLSLVLMSSLLFSFSIPVYAADPSTKCFTSASGILKIGTTEVFSSQNCSPGDLISFIDSLNHFFYRLAIVLAVLMITVGGMQWLLAIGNAGKIGNAKDTIQDAILGLILALTAILFFNQIDTSFTELNTVSLVKPTQTTYKCSEIKSMTVCGANTQCKWVLNDLQKPLGDGYCTERSNKFEGCSPQTVKEAEARWTRRTQDTGKQDQYCYITLNERSCLDYAKNGLRCCKPSDTSITGKYMYAIGGPQQCQTCSQPDGSPRNGYWVDTELNFCDTKPYSQILEK